MSKLNVERILRSVESDMKCELQYVDKPPFITWGNKVVSIDADCIVSNMNIGLLNSMSQVKISRIMVHDRDSYVFDFYDQADALIPPGLIIDVGFSNKALEPDCEGESFILELMLNGNRVVVLPALIDSILHFNLSIH